MSETLDRPFGNPLSPVWFNERMAQEADARHREAFGATEENPVEVVTQSGQSYPVEVTDPLPQDVYSNSRVMSRISFLRRVDTETFEDTLMEVYDEAFDIMVARQRRYGPQNIIQQGMWGVLTRLSDDKLSRIKRAFNGNINQGIISLIPIEETDDVETFEDAVLDAINYLVILLLLKRGKWGKPLADEVSTE